MPSNLTALIASRHGMCSITLFDETCDMCDIADPWAAQYNTRLLNKLTPKGVVISFLSVTLLTVKLHWLDACLSVYADMHVFDVSAMGRMLTVSWMLIVGALPQLRLLLVADMSS